MCSSVRIFAAIAGLLAAINVARAADLPAPAPASVPAVPFTWSGLYIGLNAGYSGATLTETLSGAVAGTASTNIPGFIGGVQLGVNYQISAVVLGFETDFDGSTQNKSVNVGALATNTAQIPWIATFRARAGLAFDRLLVYVTGGGAATELVSTVNVNGGIGSASTNQTHSGWTAGGGLEAAVTNTLSARVEYLYFDAGNFSIASVNGPPLVAASGHLKDSMVRAGVNYRFPVAW